MAHIHLYSELSKKLKVDDGKIYYKFLFELFYEIGGVLLCQHTTNLFF